MLLEGLSFMSGDILTHVLCFVCGDETLFPCSGRTSLHTGVYALRVRCYFRHSFAYDVLSMGLDYEDHPDWPKMGPSLLIATCLILAIRTAKWTVRSADSTASDVELDREIEHAAHLAGRVFARLVSKHPSIFPQAKQPWYQANDEDEPK